MHRLAALLSLFVLGPVAALLYRVTGWVAPARLIVAVRTASPLSD